MTKKESVFLVIDDKLDNLVSLKALIKESFPRAIILTAQSGHEGLMLAKMKEPDIILLDIMMPDMDGFEVCQKLKADDILQDIPVIFVTALKSDRQTRTRALESGAEAFLTKPIDDIELFAQLGAMLKIRELNIKNRATIKKLKSELISKTQTMIENEEKIKDSLNMFMLLAERINDAMYFIDMDGNIIDANPAALQLYGYSFEELMTKKIYDLRRDENVELISRQMNQAAKDGIIFEAVHYKKDNSSINVEVSAKGTVIGDKKILLSIVRDISERKKAEDLLRASEEKFKAAFMTSPDAFYWATLRDGKILEVNASFESVFGYSRDEVIGKTSLDLGLYAEPSDRARMVAELLEKGFVRDLELQGRKKGGALITVALSVSKIELSGQQFILGVIRDITERKKLEIELRDREIKYRTLYDTEEDCILLFTEGRWVDCNEKALQIFGCTREQIIGEHPINFSPPMQPDGRASDEEAIKLINLAYAGEPQLFRWEHCRADGTTFAAEVSLKRLDLGGKPYIQAIVRDLTELTETQNALTRAQTLFSAIVESTSDMIWSVDPDRFGLMTYNQALIDYFLKIGISLDVGMRPEDLFPDLAFRDQWHTLYRRALSGGSYSTEYSTKKGNISLLLTFGILKHNDNVYGISVFGKDISERKQMEIQLKQSEEKFRSSYKAIPVPVYTWQQTGDDFELADYNTEAMIFTNGRIEKLVGVKLSQMYEDNPQIQSDVRRCFHEKVIIERDMEYSLKSNGNVKFLHVKYAYMPPSFVLVHTEDFTERKSAESRITNLSHELQILSERLILATRSANIGVWDWDVVNNELIWDDGMYSLYNIHREDFSGAYEAWTYHIHPDDKAATEEAIQEALRGEQEYAPEFRIVWPDSSIRFIRARSKTFYNDDGVPVRMVGVNWDITEAKKSEKNLINAQDLYQKAQKLARSGHYVFHDTNQEFTGSDEALKIFGFDGRQKVTFEEVAQIISKNDLDRVVASVELLFNEGKPFSEEFETYPNGSGEPRYIKTIADLGQDENGDPIAIGMIQDITEQKLNELNLRKSMKQNQRILDNLQDAYYQADLSGIITMVNPSAVAMHGCKSQDELIGRSAASLYADPMGRKNLFELLKEKGKATDYYSQGLRQDGTPFPVSMNIQFIHNESGDIIGTEGLVRDISERVKAEVAIRLEAERYNALIESTNDWIWVADSENYGLIVYNTAVEDYFRRNHGIILKKGMIPEEMLSDKRIELWRGLYDRAIREGRFSIDYHTNVENLHFKVSLAPLTIENKIVGVSVFAKDITNEYQYKNELEKSNQALSTRLSQSINAISKIGELRDVYTAGHQNRVSELACAIAQELGLSEEAITNISFGAMIHDIGKIYIASDILNKPGKISNLEYQILQTHAEQSYEVVKTIDFPEQIKTMIYQHHERIDGSGYPRKLAGDEIILESRILAVADVVEAMNSHRPYRAALGIEAALDEIEKNKGTRYDADVVDACIRLFRGNMFMFK